MALNFPASPSENDTYVSGSITYTWDGTSWKASSSFNETDPVFTASPAHGIGSVDISNWNTAYGWGDHSTWGYLTTETDPVFIASAASEITSTQVSNWDSAYSWGDHATEGYIKTTGSIDSHTDVIITSPTNGQVLRYNGGVWANDSGGCSLQSRTIAQATTSSIADGASTYMTIVAAKTYALQKIQTSSAAWITLYRDTTSRTNDATRDEITDPSPDSGVIVEVITTEAATQKITPGIVGWNDDETPSSNVYLKVVNKSGITQAITVTLHYVQLEN